MLSQGLKIKLGDANSKSLKINANLKSLKIANIGFILTASGNILSALMDLLKKIWPDLAF